MRHLLLLLALAGPALAGDFPSGPPALIVSDHSKCQERGQNSCLQQIGISKSPHSRISDLPDNTLTPGLADPALTREVLCAKGFTTRNVRNVPASEKREVYASYGASPHKGICAGKEGCEVDHLIPLTIGGSNDVTNLWPQPYRGEWSAHVKDKLENRLRPLVCSGKLDLDHAQRAIAEDWIAFYHLVFDK